MKALNLEQLSEPEIEKAEREISDKLGHLIIGYSGNAAVIDLVNALTVNTTVDIIKNFRTLGLNSYRKGEFDDSIPKFMRPLVDRADTLSVGNEVQYHNSRRNYIGKVVSHVKKDPKLIKLIEGEVYKFFLENIFAGEMDVRKFSNAMLHFRQLENNACDVYSIYCLEEFGRPHYITGIDDDGTVHTSRFARESDHEELFVYNKIHSHAPVFMTIDSDVTEKLIRGGARWADRIGRLEGLGHENSGLAGFELLEAGIENKHFHSSEPYEVLIKSDGIESVTVVDHPPRGVGFSTKFSDGTVSIGYMESPFESGEDKSFVAYNSDLLSNFVLNNRFYSGETNFLFDLVGAIARDMFVCVERDRYYTRGSVGGGKPGKKRNRVTWLPRFKINLKEREGHGEVMEKVVNLSPCHVSGHPRKCDNPSERQLEIAKALGINLPQGYTYVQEYDRGASEQRRLYKSRSAMSMLFERK